MFHFIEVVFLMINSLPHAVLNIGIGIIVVVIDDDCMCILLVYHLWVLYFLPFDSIPHIICYTIKINGSSRSFEHET